MCYAKRSRTRVWEVTTTNKKCREKKALCMRRKKKKKQWCTFDDWKLFAYGTHDRNCAHKTHKQMQDLYNNGMYCEHCEYLSRVASAYTHFIFRLIPHSDRGRRQSTLSAWVYKSSTEKTKCNPSVVDHKFSCLFCYFQRYFFSIFFATLHLAPSPRFLSISRSDFTNVWSDAQHIFTRSTELHLLLVIVEWSWEFKRKTKIYKVKTVVARVVRCMERQQNSTIAKPCRRRRDDQLLKYTQVNFIYIFHTKGKHIRQYVELTTTAKKIPVKVKYSLCFFCFYFSFVAARNYASCVRLFSSLRIF